MKNRPFLFVAAGLAKSNVTPRGKRYLCPVNWVMLGCPTHPAPKFDFEVILPLPKHLSSSLPSARQLFEKDCLIPFFSKVLCPLVSGEGRETKALQTYFSTFLPNIPQPNNSWEPSTKDFFPFSDKTSQLWLSLVSLVPHTRVPSTTKLAGSFYLSHLELIWSAQTDTCGQTSASLESVERNWSLTHHPAEHGSEGHGFPLFLAETGCGIWFRCASYHRSVSCLFRNCHSAFELW